MLHQPRLLAFVHDGREPSRVDLLRLGLTDLRLRTVVRRWQRDETDKRVPGFTVLCAWGSGRHDLIGFSLDPDAAARRLRRRERAWRRPGPYPRPTFFAVVPASRFETRHHDRDGCATASCRWTEVASRA